MKSYGLERTGANRVTTCSTVLPANELRSRALELVQKIEPYVFELGQVLFRIKDEQLFLLGQTTYASFNDYCEGELHYSSRRARYLASTYDKFTQANIGGDIVNELGSSKSRLLARVIDSGNAEIWIDKARNTTYSELENEIKYEQQGKVIQGCKLGSINIPYYNGETRIQWLEMCELIGRMTGCNGKEAVLEALMAEFQGTYGETGTHDQDAISQGQANYEILKKYNWRCGVEDCNNRLTLAVHHIAFRSQRPDLIDTPSNKIPLCLFHHNLIHNERADLIEIDGKFAIKLR